MASNPKGNQPAAAPDGQITHVKSKPALCQLLGISRQTLWKCVKRGGAPQKSSKGYDVEQWKSFLLSCDVRPLVNKQPTEDDTKAHYDKLQSKFKARLLEIEMAKAEGRIIEKAIYDSDLAALASVFANGLNTLAGLLAANLIDAKAVEVAGKAVEDVRLLVQGQIRKMAASVDVRNVPQSAPAGSNPVDEVQNGRKDG